MIKKFRQWLNEAPWVNSAISDIEDEHKKKRKELPHPELHYELKRAVETKHLGKMGDMDVHERVGKTDDDGKQSSYYLSHHGKVHFVVHGTHAKNGFNIHGLGGYASPIKAHEFYHHLITKHNIHLHSDYEQSEGGMKVWKKLHKMPGIHMQSFNGSSEKYSELKPSFQRKYDMDSSTRLAAKKK